MTGASAGIGRGIAHVFAREGAKVVIASRSALAGARVVQEIQEAGGEALFVQADVSKKSDNEPLLMLHWRPTGALTFWCTMQASFGKSCWTP